VNECCRKAADARAEEIAWNIQKRLLPSGYSIEAACAWYLGTNAAADIARATITKPKTREQVLEEALREIQAGANPDKMHESYLGEVARRALEWKS